MALTGLQILKLLPEGGKKNCGDCGVPTCLAFAMKLAAKKAELGGCPHLSDEGRAAIGASAAPPIRTVRIGEGERAVLAGGETVLFRHERAFLHPTAIAVAIPDDLPDDEIADRSRRLGAAEFERLGQKLSLDLLGVRAKAGDAERFARAAAIVAAAAPQPPIWLAEDPAAIGRALAALPGRRPLIGPASEETLAPLATLAREQRAVLALRSGGSLEALAALAARARSSGVEDLVLEVGGERAAQRLRDETLIRRAALKGSRDLGHPTLERFAGGGAPLALALAGAVCKYAAIASVDDIGAAELLPILTLRQNLFTDPQKPLQVAGGIYPLGEPGRGAPVLVTTNFSLTTSIVTAEVEASGIAAHLLVVEAEGLSVLTAWAAGKFTAETVAKAVERSAVAGRVDHRALVLPGYASPISGELAERLPGWSVAVGPQEAADLPGFLREEWPRLGAAAPSR